MKKTILLVSAAVLLFASCNKSGGKISLKSDNDTLAYAIGVLMGTNLQSIKKDVPEFNKEILLASLSQALDSQKMEMDVKSAQAFMQGFQVKMQAKESTKNIAEEKEFLEKNKSNAGVTSLPEGVQYSIETAGSGEAPKSMEDTVVVHYKGTFLDGKVFDSSIERGTPWEAALNGTIAGWQDAMPIFKVGSKLKLWVPSARAYGERMMNKMLIFEIEVLGVKPAKVKKGKK